ncbi:MAG: hypothetical protein ACRD0Q_11110 [Acidimicrobiales bacterium]
MRRKRNRAIGMCVVLAVFGLGLGASPAVACSFITPEGLTTEAEISAYFEAEALRNAELVFEGVALTSEESLTPMTTPDGSVYAFSGRTDWKFRVDRVVKGDEVRKVAVSSNYTSRGRSSCAHPFTAGHRYLVYAATFEGRLYEGMGTRDLVPTTFPAVATTLAGATPTTAAMPGKPPLPAKPVPGRASFAG